MLVSEYDAELYNKVDDMFKTIWEQFSKHDNFPGSHTSVYVHAQ